MKISLTETQFQLVEKTAAEGVLGRRAGDVLQAAVIEHAKYLLGGGGPYDGGGRTTLETDLPRPGKARFEHVLEPVTGKAVPVYKGEVLRLTQIEGGQCIDFNAYNLHDYKEYLDCGYNRLKGMSFGKGTIVWTGSPRGRAMWVILDHSESLDQYFAGHRCNAVTNEMEYGITDHPNCQDTFAEAIREWDLTPDDTHTSYNLWMLTTVDAEGRRRFHRNRAQKGDFVDLMAVMDTLAVPIICGSDLNVVNNFDVKPVKMEIFEASAETSALVNEIQSRWSGYENQLTPDRFLQPNIKSDRALRPNPKYTPAYRRAHGHSTIDVDVSSEVRGLLESLVKTGVYGPRLEDAIVFSFFRWYEQNRVQNRMIKLAFREGEG